MKNRILKKGLVVSIICLLMLMAIPTTIGTEEYNLIVNVNSVRKIFPRIYIEETYGDFEILVSNEGPNDCDGCTVELKYYALLGYEPGELKSNEIEIGTIPANEDHSEIIHHHFGSLSPVGLFVIYKLQITVDIDDLEQDDNIDSFIFIVLGY